MDGAWVLRGSGGALERKNRRLAGRRGLLPLAGPLQVAGLQKPVTRVVFAGSATERAH